MPLTSRSWVQITASSTKFTWLARHRRSGILGNNGVICLLWMGRFILGAKNAAWENNCMRISRAGSDLDEVVEIES